MPEIIEETDIPADKIDFEEKLYKDDGATTQRVKTGTTFTLIATYPNEPDSYQKKKYGENT